MQSIRNGFTMLELIVVIVVIGILAAMVVPKFAAAQSESTVLAAGEDLMGMARALDVHFSQRGYWPADTSAGDVPPEMSVYFKGENPFLKPCPIGSIYDYDYSKSSKGMVASITLKPQPGTSGPKMVDVLALDTFIDDGVLSTGRFTAVGNGYNYRISK